MGLEPALMDDTSASMVEERKMNDDPPEVGSRPVARHHGDLKQAARAGAFLTSTLFVGAAALQNIVNGWLLAVSILGVLVSPLIVSVQNSKRSRGEHRTTSTGGPHVLINPLLDDVPDPIILVDRRSIVLAANASAHSLLPGLKIGHPLSFALRSPDVLAAIETARKSQDLIKIEYVERAQGERTFEVRVKGLRQNILNKDEVSAVLLVFRDLTEARKVEQMRVDFVANASHELRTPLASLLGFIETLQGPARNDAAARDRFLSIMYGQARRMTRLIDDLLSLSRIEMRAHLPPQTSVELQPLLNQMLETLSPLALEQGVEIRLNLAGEPIWVLGDRDELARLIDNLVENAIKYGASGRFVDVGLARTTLNGNRHPEVYLSVQDYGAGIAPEHLPRLTERFYRADVTQSREKGGTGLGLSIVKHIVNRHRGRLTVESELGAGARFTIHLPEHRAH
jgi:two-component system phosphate regulon sensor histidine kinase PhoR